MTTNTHIAAQARKAALYLSSSALNMDRHAGEILLQCAQALEAAPALDAQGEVLKDMEARKDAAYLERNRVVAALASAYPSGITRTAIDGWSEDWHGCVYIDLPTGQASWHYHDSQAHLFAHLPPYTGSWDGHSTAEKYQRLARLAPPPPAVGKPLSEEKAAGDKDRELSEGAARFLAFHPDGKRRDSHGIVTKETGT